MSRYRTVRQPLDRPMLVMLAMNCAVSIPVAAWLLGVWS